MKDFAMNNPDIFECTDLSAIAAWVDHADYMISLAERDPDLAGNIEDLSNLILRKSTLASCIGDYTSAEAFAKQALQLCRSALGFFRLGCAQYCQSKYIAAMESFAAAEELEPSNSAVQKAISVCLARTRSVKDRLPVVSSSP